MKYSLSWLVLLSLIANNASAQIIPDASLGSEKSVVNSNGNRDTIDGGAIRDTNLFHSFQEFNVGAGREAYFTNPSRIDNIFSRVTGNSFSNIQGVLGVLGDANLFLINPNGILFGSNARLDVNGSFFATTADSVVFGNGIEFSATNPNQPPLLTIDIPIGLRFRDNPAPIFNLSVANDLGLQVKPEETLGLIGGNVLLGGKIVSPGSNIELGGLLATGIITLEEGFKFSFPENINRADVFLSAAEVNVASDGGGAITVNGSNIDLIGGSQLVGGIAEGLGNSDSQAGDITLNATGGIGLTNESSIQNRVNRNAIGNSGNINVNSNSLTLISGSGFSTSTLGLGNGGDINLNVAEAVVLDGVTEDSITRFASVVSSGARGNAGEININAGSLTVSNGALINTRVSFAEDGNSGGIGNGGDINIDVKEAVTVAGFTQVNNDSEPIFSAVISRLSSGAEGSAGDINIRAGSLSLEDGGFLSGSIFGQGSAGDINIDVQEAVTITNTGGIFSAIGEDAIVPAGERSNVTIKAGSLFITDAQSTIFTSTLGIGDAGDISIEVSSVSLEDGSFLVGDTSGIGNASNITVFADEKISLANGSFIGSNVSSDAVGQGGQIDLTTQSLSLSGRSFIATATFSEDDESNGGNIEVDVAESLNLTGDSFLSSDTGGKGNAGNITINGEGATILIQGGENSDSQISTSNNATGNAGDINITGRSLFLENGGFLRSNTLGQGNAGNITIDVDENISLVNGSYIGSAVSQDAVGQGGQINLTAKSVSLSEVSLISTATFSDNEQSNGGNIEVNVSESLSITTNSFLSSNTDGKSNAGNITINGNEATILVQGRGNIGDGANISNSSGGKTTGNAGDIKITGRSLALKDGGTLSSFTLGQGLPGNIMIDIEENLTLINNGGISSFVGDKAVVPEAEKSTIQINAGSLSIAENSSITTFSEGIGIAGDVVIDVDDAFDFVGGLITSELRIGAEGKAGNIDITARSLTLEDGAVVNSSTLGEGNSGIVSITTEEAVTLSGAGTTIFNNVERGAVGNSQGIFIEAESLSLTEGAQIQTIVRGALDNNPAGVGNGGDIEIKVRDGVSLSGVGIDRTGISLNSLISSELGIEATGKAGEINIQSRSLSLDEGARLNSSSFGIGDAGKITLDIQDTVNLSGFAFDSEGVEIFSTQISSFLGETAIGNAGDISLKARSLSIDNGARLINSSFGMGDAGNITLDLQDAVNISGFSPSNNRKGILSSQITSALGIGAIGNAGEINLKARSLFLDNGATLNTISFGMGDGGNITLDIQDAINVSGFSPNSDGTDVFSSQINSALGLGAEGNAGNIDIKARSLYLADSATLTSRNSGKGDSGNITLDIEDTVSLSGFALNREETEISPTQLSSFSEIQGNAGNINLKSRSLSLEDGAAVSSFSAGKGNAGQITLDIEDTITISGLALNRDQTSSFPAVVNSELAAGAEGRAGDIIIEARSLLLEDGGQINNTTFGTGDAGDIDITVDDSVNLFGYSIINNSVGGGGVGEGGDLDIQARSLTLREGSQIGAVVFRAGFDTPGGTGEGGNITITATDFIDIAGVSTVQFNIPDLSGDPSNTTGLIPTAGFSSGVLAATQRGASGDGGTITITTDGFRIADGAVIDNSTTNDSNAGSITINANTFEATGGGQIITATRGNGNSADIKLNITDNIFISGSDPRFSARLARANEFGSIQGGENIVTNQGAASGIFANTSADSTGDGGSISIGIFQQQGETLVLAPNQFTQEVTLANGAKIAADSQGEGNGGVIWLQAQDLTLDNQAEILAETRARQDNNTARSEINLVVADILQLKNDSRISTQAFSNADGGNINIDAKFIIAFPGQNEGSDILTRAEQEGTGGDINITAEALLGIQERKATPGNETNDIDASSEFGLSGEVSIEQPTVDPTSGLVELTQEVVDASKLIAQNVCTQTANSEFVDIGKGGLPQNPDDVLTGDSMEVGLVAPIISGNVEANGIRPTEAGEKNNYYLNNIETEVTRKPPAQGWIWKEDGTVELVAYNPQQVGDQRTWNNQRACQ